MKENIPLEFLELLAIPSNPDLRLINYTYTAKELKIQAISYPEAYFTIELKRFIFDRRGNYNISCKPSSEKDNGRLYVQLSMDSIKDKFKLWLSIIAKFESLETIFDDPILNKYQKDFADKVKNVDADAEFAPFSYDQQVYISGYLDSVIKSANERKTDGNKAEMDEIINESQTLKHDLTQSTKSQVIKKLTKIWARAQKIGLEFIKEIFINVSAEIMLKLLTGP